MAATNQLQKVSLEALAENEIQEIAYDGTEKAVIPMHLSDNLAKLAQLIDFGKAEKSDEELIKPEAAGPSKQETKAKTAELKQPKPWPWEWLRTSLVSSLTEMNVLSDCLAIAKDKRVMVLDKIENSTPVETKSAYQLATRKAALLNAQDIFSKGGDKLRGIQKETAKSSTDATDFYVELCALRQHWRIKKVGQHILGDLSYKSAGSRYWQSGTFEIFKRTINGPGQSALDVKIPPELEGNAYIQVSIHMTTSEDSVSKMNSMLTVPQILPTSPDETTRWQSKLEAAQNVIFCKELFTQLSREAFKLDSTIPQMVANNQVIVHLFPGFKMHILFAHSSTDDKEADAVRPVSDPSLQLALHQLLREQHFVTLHKDPPHPVTASIGPTKRRRIAGPTATPRAHLMAMELPEKENILEKMIDISRHVILRLRMVETLEHIATTISDPLLQIHTDGLSDSTHTTLRVTIISNNYDLIKSCFILRIRGGDVSAVGRSGIEISLSHDTQKLEDYVAWQRSPRMISQYQVLAVHKLAHMMGWNILSYSFSSTSQHTQVFGTNPSILISSTDGTSAIAVRGNCVSGLEILVSDNSQNHTSIPSDLITDYQWSLLRQKFKHIDLSKMPGRGFMNKIELLLAVYGGRVMA